MIYVFLQQINVMSKDYQADVISWIPSKIWDFHGNDYKDGCVTGQGLKLSRARSPSDWNLSSCDPKTEAEPTSERFRLFQNSQTMYKAHKSNCTQWDVSSVQTVSTEYGSAEDVSHLRRKASNRASRYQTVRGT
jgi:hypothetical protein